MSEMNKKTSQENKHTSVQRILCTDAMNYYYAMNSDYPVRGFLWFSTTKG